jgi:hypothetical protein
MVVPTVPDRDRPPTERDSLDCGLPRGMQLQNAVCTRPTNIPLLYVCYEREPFPDLDALSGE